MKLKTYKSIGFLFVAFFISSLQAQKKFDKKYSENFKTNKDVTIRINATNADINVTTWNRNEVSVEAVITVEGLDKKEAQEFLKSWKFEALGNKSKVEINANANRFLLFGDNDFKFDFDFGDIVIPEINFDNIKIEIPEFEMPEFEMPEINLNFNEIWNEIDEYDFDNDDHDGIKTFTYQSNGKKKEIVIKSKKEWEAFKKTKDYTEFKKDLRKKLKEVQEKFNNIDMKKIHDQINKAKIQIQNIDKKKIQEQIRKAQIQYQKIDKVKIRKSLEAAKISIEKMKIRMADRYKNGDNIIIIEDDKGKRNIKITRKITIKVPKNAKFDLNTRHSKVKLPKGKVSGKVSYGTFNAEEINGGDLNIYFSPVDVRRLQESTLTLNNVTDATIASVMNTKLTSTSSKLKIQHLESGVEIISKFGELVIDQVISSLKGLKLDLVFSDATIDFNNLKGKFPTISASKINTLTKNSTTFIGDFKAKNTVVDLKGKQSELTIKKQ